MLLQLGALGTIVLGGANDLLLLFAAFLLASVPFYALAGWDKSALGTEAAMKYYLSGAFLGVAMLTGVAILYGVGRTTGYGTLRDGLAAAPVAAAGGGAGRRARRAAVQDRRRARRTSGCPTSPTAPRPPVAAIVTTIPKIGGLVAAYRLLVVAIPADVLDWPLLVAVLAAASMTLGNLAAFFQTTVQRLLAYSTISQVGYLLVAVAVAGRAELAQPALLFYLAGYAVTNLGAFAVVGRAPAARAPSTTTAGWPGGIPALRGRPRRLPASG